MPRSSVAEYRDVDAWLTASGVLLAVVLVLAAARRRSARRELEAKTRARARRQKVPLVSANVRGQSDRRTDIWRDEREAAARDEPVA